MLPLIGLGIGLAGSIGKMIGRGKANREMEQLIKEDPKYSTNPLAGQRLSLARTLLNARAPGAVQAERNIYGNRANQLGRLDRTATDSSQALAVASGIGANTDAAFTDLAQDETQDYQRRYDNVYRAEEGVIREGDKLFEDDIRRFGNKTQFKGAQAENRANNWGDLSGMGFALADFGLSGGFDNMFGGNGSEGGLSQRSMTQGQTAGRPNGINPGTFRQMRPPSISYNPLRR